MFVLDPDPSQFDARPVDVLDQQFLLHDQATAAAHTPEEQAVADLGLLRGVVALTPGQLDAEASVYGGLTALVMIEHLAVNSGLGLLSPAELVHAVRDALGDIERGFATLDAGEIGQARDWLRDAVSAGATASLALAGAEPQPEQQADGALMVGDASPTPFAFFNDPLSTIDTSNILRTVTGNTIALTGGQAVNLTDQTLPDVGLFVPFAWPRIDNPDGSGTLVAMTWSNLQDGWFTPDFDGTGTSLLVTLDMATPDDIPNGRVAAGSVAADETLTGVLGPTSVLAGFSFPEETLLPGDLLPFVGLGSFSPLEAKPFDLVFTYQWGDGSSSGALRTAFAAFTLAPVSVPEHDYPF